MSEAVNLAHGFAVGILRNPAESLEVWNLIEMDRAGRREDALLRSGPPVDLTASERSGLNDGNWSMGVVAVDLVSQRYIGYVSVHKIVTRGRGTKVEIEEVVVHQVFERLGVGKTIMAVTLQEARSRWGARKAVLTSRASRVAARGLYAAFGFEQQGEGDQFALTFGDGHWALPERARPRYWSGVDREEHGAFWHMTSEMQHVVSQICAGTLTPMAPWTIIEPIGVYKYKDAP